jgi:hypothetical protein
MPNQTTQQLIINFGPGVELDNEDWRRFQEATSRVCDKYNSANPGRVMWPAGIEAAILGGIWDDNLKFSDTISEISCQEREDYKWRCNKCGMEQWDYKYLGTAAGDCEYELVPKRGTAWKGFRQRIFQQSKWRKRRHKINLPRCYKGRGRKI